MKITVGLIDGYDQDQTQDVLKEAYMAAQDVLYYLGPKAHNVELVRITPERYMMNRNEITIAVVMSNHKNDKREKYFRVHKTVKSVRDEVYAGIQQIMYGYLTALINECDRRTKELKAILS